MARRKGQGSSTPRSTKESQEVRNGLSEESSIEGKEKKVKYKILRCPLGAINLQLGSEDLFRDPTYAKEFGKYLKKGWKIQQISGGGSGYLIILLVK